MAFVELKSDIQIGTFRFSGVHEVVTNRGLHHYADSAFIKIPSIAYVQKGKVENDGTVTITPGTAKRVITGSQFTDGDPVTIKLGYKTPFDTSDTVVLQEEFRGFVKRRSLDMPLGVECEGYVRQLRLNNSLEGNFKKTSAKELLLLACEGTDIKVDCPVDFPLTGIRLLGCNGAEIIEHIKKCSDCALTIFFKEPDVLWCGLTYTPYLAGQTVFNKPTVNYRLGWNVVKDNGLKERIPSEPVQVIINGKTVTGDLVRTESKDKTAKRKVKFLLNNVPDDATLQAFAQEKQLTMNYTGYEGHINGFLQPYCLPGYVAHIVDKRYPERNGDYLIESVQTKFGLNGARRIVGIGPKVRG
jgi:hypothetical protein